MNGNSIGIRKSLKRLKDGKFKSLELKPLCHPDRKYYAKDLCENCYKKRQAAQLEYKHQKNWKAQNPIRNHKKRIKEQVMRTIKEKK